MQKGTAPLEYAGDRPGVQDLKIVFQQAGIALVVADHLNVVGDSGAGRGTDGGVHAGTVTAAGQDCKSFHGIPHVSIYRFGKNILQRRAAVIENLFQARGDDQAVHQPGQLVVEQQVMHQVPNLYASIHLAEKMLMMPETIRPKALFVNKEIGL